MKTISFVIAVYQNEHALTLTYHKIKDVFNEQLPNYHYEILFVDDGSTDNSVAELKALREEDKQVKIISFTRNFGKMPALLAGFKHATGDAIITLSANLHDPIELIPQMISHWEAKSQIVICHRELSENKFTAKLFSKISYAILRKAVPGIPKGGFDVVLMDCAVLPIFNDISNRNRFFQGDLLWTGYSTSLIPYQRPQQKIPAEQAGFLNALRNFSNALLDTSYLPIRFISFMGFMTACSGFIYLLSLLFSYFFEKTSATSWPPIMVAILMIGGLIMLMLGVIGEYIWRIYDEVRKKPNYIIKEILL